MMHFLIFFKINFSIFAIQNHKTPGSRCCCKNSASLLIFWIFFPLSSLPSSSSFPIDSQLSPLFLVTKRGSLYSNRGGFCLAGPLLLTHFYSRLLQLHKAKYLNQKFFIFDKGNPKFSAKMDCSFDNQDIGCHACGPLIQSLENQLQQLRHENEELMRRVNTLEKSRPSCHQCPLCLKFYGRADALKAHVKYSQDEAHISLAAERYAIETCCSRSFRRRCDLDRHRKGRECERRRGHGGKVHRWKSKWFLYLSQQ